MLTEYIHAAPKRTKSETLSDDRTFYGSISDFQGVCANAGNLEDCRNELAEVLEG
jgi:hypothetical protein